MIFIDRSHATLEQILQILGLVAWHLFTNHPSYACRFGLVYVIILASGDILEREKGPRIL